jgi:signal transduction histidine kinase
MIREISQQKITELEYEELLTRERKARDLVEESLRCKETFIAVISHELRTPLTAILGWMCLLKHHDVDEETRKRGIDVIERSAQLQLHLIEDLIEHARIINGKLRLDLQPINSAAAIKAALEILRPIADGKKIHIRLLLDTTEMMIMGDPTRLQQVLWNLFSNAVKFTPYGDQVEVKLERAGHHARITVKDRGEGISQQELPYLFDCYFQAGQSSRQKGLGLGLWIARYLVELHGGSIQAESPGEGLGATFTVYLPLLC